LVHVGFVIAKVDEEQALQTINFWHEERKNRKAITLTAPQDTKIS
jgi:hydrogenase maturation factor